MDREVDPAFRKKRIVRRSLVSIGLVALTSTALIWGPGWVRPSVSRETIRTARVETGPIESVITTSGTVRPEFEQVLSCPIETRVVRILKRAGAILAEGEPIVQLDVREAELALEKAIQQIELKQNQTAKAKLDLESTLIGLKSQWQIKNLDYKSFKTNSARNHELLKAGLVSEAQ